MSVSAPLVTAPLLKDGTFTGLVQVVSPVGLAPGATAVLHSSSQPDKVCKIASVSGINVQLVGLDAAATPTDASAFQTGHGACLIMPAQTVDSIPSGPTAPVDTLTVAGDASVGDDLTVTDDLAVTGLVTIGETLAVTGVSTLASAVVTGAATVGTTLGVTGAATLSSTCAVTGALTAGGVKALASRLQEAKGADVASAGTVTLGADGNYFVISGTTSIDYITKTGWQAGSEITLMTSGSLTLKHNTGSVPGTAGALFLVGAADVSMTANDFIKLMFDGTLWRQSTPVVVV